MTVKWYAVVDDCEIHSKFEFIMFSEDPCKMSAEGSEMPEVSDDVLVEGVTTMDGLEDIINSTLNKLHFNDYCNPKRLQNKMRTLESMPF